MNPFKPKKVSHKPPKVKKPARPLASIMPATGNDIMEQPQPPVNAAAQQPMMMQKPQILGSMHKGGTIPKDGLYQMKKGEKVIPAPTSKTKEPCPNCSQPKDHDGECCSQASPDDIKQKHAYKRFEF